MKTNSKRILGLLAITWMTLMRINGATPDAETNVVVSARAPEQMKTLESIDDQAFTMLADGVYRTLQATQQSLLDQLGSSNKEARCRAAFLLGEYRFPGAVAKLSQAITLEATFRSNPKEWYWDRYPMMEALGRIGNPSIPTMIRNLEESDDKLVRELSMKVLGSIDGDKEIVKFRLQRALDAEKDPQKITRLQYALKSVLETPPSGNISGRKDPTGETTGREAK